MSKDTEKDDREALIQDISNRVADNLAKRQPQPIHAYSVCPNCGYQFLTKEFEDQHDECPVCQYKGKTVILKWVKE